MTNTEKLRVEIISQLGRQGITSGPECTLHALRYLDENGEIIEPPEWIEMLGGEPGPLELLEPPKPSERALTWTALVNVLAMQAARHSVEPVIEAAYIERQHPE